MAQFEVGGKCVCITGSKRTVWASHGRVNIYGPKLHQKVTICEIQDVANGDLFLAFDEYPSDRPDGESLGYHSIHFRPLESWPDLAQSAVQETVATIHEPQPA